MTCKGVLEEIRGDMLCREQIGLGHMARGKDFRTKLGPAPVS